MATRLARSPEKVVAMTMPSAQDQIKSKYPSCGTSRLLPWRSKTSRTLAPILRRQQQSHGDSLRRKVAAHCATPSRGSSGAVHSVTPSHGSMAKIGDARSVKTPTMHFERSATVNLVRLPDLSSHGHIQPAELTNGAAETTEAQRASQTGARKGARTGQQKAIFHFADHR